MKQSGNRTAAMLARGRAAAYQAGGIGRRSASGKVREKSSSSGAGRVAVAKTRKLFINGAFPRSESERSFAATSANGSVLANVAQASRKDFRDAVTAARAAFPGWSSKSAFNRSQILYRCAEILEGRKEQFIAELAEQGENRSAAAREVTTTIDRLVYYAGWCDKFQQIFSSVNPVAANYFNFSILEPMGVVAAVAPRQPSLLGLATCIASAISGGNCVIALASQSQPLAAISFAEVLHSSDVPAGTVNILTGYASELVPHFASHMDVNAVLLCGAATDSQLAEEAQKAAAQNLKRIIFNDWSADQWLSDAAEDPQMITKIQEVKTIWHPIGW